MPKITTRTVSGLKAGTSDVFTWDSGDGALKGFGVRMKPSGAASYLVQYRNAEGRTRRLAFAKVGTVTPDEARAMARERLAAVSKGEDPSASRKALRRSLTIAELCDRYITDPAVCRDVKASTLAMDRSRIDRHVKPLIGARRVEALTTADVEKMQDDIVAGRSAPKKQATGRGGKTKGGKGVASRTVGMLGTILAFAVKKKLVKENVARGVTREKEGKQKTFLDADKLAALGTAMRKAADVGESAKGLAAIRFLLMSGCRRMEALTLTPTMPDRRAGCIRFPDTKSGEQVRPIARVAFAALPSYKPTDAWVFPAERGDGHFVGVPRVLARLCKQAELTGVTVHVLRHSFAAMAASMGYSELTIAGLLGHTVSGVTARYAHVADAALVSAANRVADAIADALDGRATDNVVRLEVRS